MAKATDTKTNAAPKPAKAKATDTTTQPAFDAKANRLATQAERAARKGGEKLKTERYTVKPGQSVRQGGERFTEGEAIDLTAADAERLLAKGVVAKGDAGAAAVKANTDKADKAQADADAAAEAQRLADEQAAKDKAEADEAAGKLSGTENR